MVIRIDFYVEPDSYLDTHFEFYDPEDDYPNDIYIDVEIEGSVVEEDYCEESSYSGYVDCEVLSVMTEIKGKYVDIYDYLSSREIDKIREKLVEAYYGEDYGEVS